MRAVSSPSLSENPLDTITTNKINVRDSQLPTNSDGCTTGTNHDNQSSGSVLQKLKNTLSHLKGGGKSTNVNTPTSNMNSSTDSTTYRFGPLVWRSSKERRKAKHQRRDKCNSGDSGIQVELDNEDITHHAPESLETAPAPTTYSNVRRANSAKVQSSTTVKAKVLRKNEGLDRLQLHATPLPARSLSQPTGLDRLSKGNLLLFFFCI